MKGLVKCSRQCLSKCCVFQSPRSLICLGRGQTPATRWSGLSIGSCYSHFALGADFIDKFSASGFSMKPSLKRTLASLSSLIGFSAKYSMPSPLQVSRNSFSWLEVCIMNEGGWVSPRRQQISFNCVITSSPLRNGMLKSRIRSVNGQ